MSFRFFIPVSWSSLFSFPIPASIWSQNLRNPNPNSEQIPINPNPNPNPLMFKSRLQELCHQRMWPAPDYTVSRDGPAHNPSFGASVTVNGVKFDAPDFSKSSKEAQNKAAQAAVDHFSVVLPPPTKASPQIPGKFLFLRKCPWFNFIINFELWV